MKAKFFKLGPKNPNQSGTGRRYQALYVTRELLLAADTRPEAYAEAAELAESYEVVVQLDKHFPVPLPNCRTPVVMDILRRAGNNREGFIVYEVPDKPRPELRVWLDGRGMSASEVNWLAIYPGSVCEIDGTLYQLQGDYSLRPV